MRIITLILALGAWAASVAPAHAIDFNNLRAVDFPAHVRVIVLQSGTRIDSSLNACWGKWCVNFGPEPPAAKLFGDLIHISPLVCKNPVEGAKKCSFDIQPSHKVAVISVYKPSSIALLNFNIRFPKDLILK